jgi:fengycin family lipopeptide synthetase B
VRAAAAIAIPGPDAEVRVVAYLVLSTAVRPSIIDLKTYCAGRIPAYMNPDSFRFVEELPQTSTSKTDYQTLARLAGSGV